MRSVRLPPDLEVAPLNSTRTPRQVEGKTKIAAMKPTKQAKIQSIRVSLFSTTCEVAGLLSEGARYGFSGEGADGSSPDDVSGRSESFTGATCGSRLLAETKFVQSLC